MEKRREKDFYREMKAKQIRGRERKKRVSQNGFLFLFFYYRGKTKRRKCLKLFFFTDSV